MNQKKYINQSVHSIDVLKFLFALSIVILHSNSYQSLPDIFEYYFEKIILRLAVPFFFTVSGYFFMLSIENGKSIKKYLLRILKPLIVFEIINIILETIKMILNGIDMRCILIDLLKHILFYPYGALWYLQASLLGALILYPFIKRKKIGIAILLGIVLYSFALINNNYYFAIKNNNHLSQISVLYMSIFISSRNGLFVGFLFCNYSVP